MFLVNGPVDLWIFLVAISLSYRKKCAIKCVIFCFRLKEFAKLYDIIKNERNKCVNLIQTSTQKAAEMREKIKILQNEIEILRTAVTQKDRSVKAFLYSEPRVVFPNTFCLL